MKKIKLGKKDIYALVDDSSFDQLNAVKWYETEGYAHRIVMKNGKRYSILMHRLITDAPKGMEVDHINGDKLDNQICNLRICTRTQNRGNTKYKNKTGFKGVSKNPKGNTYRAAIKNSKKLQYLGTFKSAGEAAKAYDIAAKEIFGEFALTNFK